MPGGIARRRLLHGAAAAGAAWAFGAPGSSPLGAPALAQVADAARAAMTSAVFAFDDKERRNWHYVPRQRQGVAFRDMPAGARTAAHELMKASLSGMGYGKAVNVLRVEGVLRELETRWSPVARTITGSTGRRS
jgi:hypothetical protein